MNGSPTAPGRSDPKRPISGALDPLAAVPAALEDLGLKLANRRARRGLTRTELADRINCTFDAVLNAENGYQPSPREFWALADSVLRANGRLLAAAARVSSRGAAANREAPSEQPQPANEALKLAPYRQVQRTHRVFADRLSTTAARRHRCPHLGETAACQRTRIKDELTVLIETIRILLRRPDFTSHDVLIDLWQTLLAHDPYHSTLVSAAALIELSKRP